jgi:hypothetical protein
MYDAAAVRDVLMVRLSSFPSIVKHDVAKSEYHPKITIVRSFDRALFYYGLTAILELPCPSDLLPDGFLIANLTCNC